MKELRNKEQLLNDLEVILDDEKSIKDLSPQARESVINEILWRITETDSLENDDTMRNCKYKGCTYWSKSALEQCGCKSENGEINFDDFNYKEENLRHEHVVPKKILKTALKEINKHSNWQEQVKNNFVGCVITTDEDQRLNKIGCRDKMPSNKSFYDVTDKWERYKELQKYEEYPNIEVYKVTWMKKGNGKIISKIEPVDM